MRNCALIIMAIAGAAMISSCEKVVFKPAPLDVSFSGYVSPLLIEKCSECHTSWTDSTHLFITLLSENMVDTSVISNSRIYIGLTSDTSHILNYISVAEQDTLTRWFTEGARGTIPPVSFITEVAPVIVSKCKTCHTTWNNTGSLYQTWVSEGILNPENVSGSPIFKSMNSSVPHNPPVSPAQRETIQKWLSQGAKNN